MRVAAPMLALGLTVFIGALLFAALGRDPLLGLYTFFIAPVSDLDGFAELLLKATPLVLCALGLAIGFRGNVWNIGAEGQLVMGAVAASGVALAFHGSGGWWVLPLIVVAGGLGGMVWAAIPAFLKTRFNANEILTSLMLTYAAIHILGYLVHGPWRDPAGYNFPETRVFEDWAQIPILIEGTRLHIGVFAAVLAVAVCWVFMSRSFAGFQIDVAGQAPAAAEYAGFNRKRIIWASFLISGGLAGLAGMAEVAGPLGQLNATFAPGYGFAAIIIAFLGRLHPVGVTIASLLMALLFLGGESLQVEMKLPKAVTGVFQGMLLFFVLACDVLVRYRLRVLSDEPKPVVDA